MSAVEREEPLVSVIIPVFEGASIICGAVTSALRQTHRNLEIFVVDDGSTDETVALLATIGDPRLHVLSQANAGTAAARNHALTYARGAYVAFLDSDDRWFPGKIAAEVAALRAHPQVVGVAYSSFYAVDDRGRLLNAAPQRTTCGIALDELLDGDDYLMPSLCTFDARIFAAIGTFNVGLYHEDHEFILRVAQRFPIVPTGRRLAVYRQSTSGKCRAILADYDRARTEELSVTRDLRGILSQTQIDRLHRNVIRSLYCRFLMYGFNASARRLLPEVDRTVLRATRKGTLAWLFAQTGVNLLVLARTVIQTFHLWARQGAWQQRLRALDVELRYD